MINKKLSELSCNKDEFDKSKLFYKKSLQETGYKTDAHTEVKNNKSKSRNIIWCNPPFSQNVKNNIGKSYRCMNNMLSFIKQHNRNVSSLSPNSEKRLCYFRDQEDCPLAGSVLFTELMLSSKMERTYIMAHLIQSLSIRTTITQIRFGIKIMKTKLNPQNIFGN